MSTALVKFDVSKLRVAARAMAAATPSPLAFLRMDKSGTWAYGADQDEIPDGQQFIVNPEGFQRGHVAWQDTSNGQAAAKLDERMYSVFEELPDPGDVPRGSRGWEPQQGCHLMGFGGKLAGKEMIYRASSDGGRRAITALLTEIAEGLESNPGKVPVITVSNSSYKHAAYGKIFKPILTLVKWVAPPAAPKTKVAPARKTSKK